ncbi:MAG: hypothetical protein OJF51_003120 [Nitrospira sp.]|nr:MAG: hypothetical protein OJF51_003120 [Nitrospira sp.]
MLKKSAGFVLARHCRFAISAAFTSVASLIRDAVRLPAALSGSCASGAQGWAGENKHPF